MAFKEILDINSPEGLIELNHQLRSLWRLVAGGQDKDTGWSGKYHLNIVSDATTKAIVSELVFKNYLNFSVHVPVDTVAFCQISHDVSSTVSSPTLGEMECILYVNDQVHDKEWTIPVKYSGPVKSTINLTVPLSKGVNNIILRCRNKGYYYINSAIGAVNMTMIAPQIKKV